MNAPDAAFKGAVALTAEQTGAIEKIVSSRRKVRSLAGPAGSGKTTLIRELISEFAGAGLRVALVTPTNKAAHVLRSKGLAAATVFKTFFVLEEVALEGGRTWMKFVPCSELHEAGKTIPAGKSAWSDVIIVDEASMMGAWVIDRVRRMCDTLVLVGDPHQLPPVNDKRVPEGFFNTMNHTATLTTIHRQGDGSPILDLATRIRTGQPHEVAAWSPEHSFAEAVAMGYQFVAFTNNERRRINLLARKVLGAGDILPVPGDRIVSLDNHSDTIINGTTMRLVRFAWDRKSVTANAEVELDGGGAEQVEMDMRAFLGDQLKTAAAGLWPSGDPSGRLKLTYAYCLTAHKAQGSEFDRVCVIDQRYAIWRMATVDHLEDQKSMPPDEVVRRWLYTAVTRARQELTIANGGWALA